MTTTAPEWVARLNDPDVVLGAHVNALRGYKRCTQAQLGAVIGVAQNTMSKKLRGEIGITFGELLQLASFFEVAVEDMIPPAYAGESVLRARRDSNPKPSVLVPARPRLRLIQGGRSGVKPRLTVYGPAALDLIRGAAGA